MVDKTYQQLQAVIHLMFVGAVSVEFLANLLSWGVVDTVARVTWLGLCLVCATWHLIGYLEHRTAANQTSVQTELDAQAEGK